MSAARYRQNSAPTLAQVSRLIQRTLRESPPDPFQRTYHDARGRSYGFGVDAPIAADLERAGETDGVRTVLGWVALPRGDEHAEFPVPREEAVALLDDATDRAQWTAVVVDTYPEHVDERRRRSSLAVLVLF